MLVNNGIIKSSYLQQNEPTQEEWAGYIEKLLIRLLQQQARTNPEVIFLTLYDEFGTPLREFTVNVETDISSGESVFKAVITNMAETATEEVFIGTMGAVAGRAGAFLGRSFGAENRVDTVLIMATSGVISASYNYDHFMEEAITHAIKRQYDLINISLEVAEKYITPRGFTQLIMRDIETDDYISINPSEDGLTEVVIKVSEEEPSQEMVGRVLEQVSEAQESLPPHSPIPFIGPGSRVSVNDESFTLLDRYIISDLALALGFEDGLAFQEAGDNANLPQQNFPDGAYLIYEPNRNVTFVDGTQMGIEELLFKLQFGLLDVQAPQTTHESYSETKERLEQQFAGIRSRTGTRGDDFFSGGIAGDSGGYWREWVENAADYQAIEESRSVVLDMLDGNDTLQGYIGNNLLIGGLGNDLYQYGNYRGSAEFFLKLLDMDMNIRVPNGGQDVILEEAGEDTLLFQEPTRLPSELEIRREGNNLAIIFKDHIDGLRITIVNWFLDPSYQIEHFAFYERKEPDFERIEVNYSISEFFEAAGFKEELQSAPEELYIDDRGYEKPLPVKSAPTYLTADINGLLLTGFFFYRLLLPFMKRLQLQY